MSKKSLKLDDANTYKNITGLTNVLELIDFNLAKLEKKNPPFVNERFEPLEALETIKSFHSVWEYEVLNDSRFEISRYSILSRNMTNEVDAAKALEAISLARKVVDILGYERLSLELGKAEELYFKEVIKRQKAGISKAANSTTKAISERERTTARNLASKYLSDNPHMELREAISKIQSSGELFRSEKTVNRYIQDLFPKPKIGRPTTN